MHKLLTGPALVVLSSFLVLACQKETAQVDPPEVPTTETADQKAGAGRTVAEPTGKTVPAPADGPLVVLLEPGAEPQKVLRYQLKKGQKEKMVMVMAMSMKMDMGQGLMDIKIPKIKMVMDMEITEIIADNAGRYSFSISEASASEVPGVMPGVTEQVNTQLGGMVGIKGTAKVDSRGFNSEVTLDLPANLDPQMAQMMESTKQSMEQMSSPLPEEAVGVGAKWELRQLIDQNGMKLKQRTRFSFLEAKGNAGKLSAEIKQIAENQQIVSNGISMELVSLKSEGNGTMRFDLAHLVPTASEVSITSKTIMKQGGQTIDMGLGMSVEITRE